MNNGKKLDISALIIKARGSDDAAFAEILERYLPMINKLISGFDAHTSYWDEAFSEATVALHKAVLSYKLDRSEVTFGLYAKICVQHRLIDFFSSVSRMDIDSSVSIETIEDKHTVGSAESALIFRENMQRCISTARTVLSDYEYRVFLLYIQNYDTDSMCRELSRDKRSVENAKARMLRHLRENSALFSDF